MAVGVIMRDDGVIDAVLIESKSGRDAVRGRFFFDASGDGDLAAWAGVLRARGTETGLRLERVRAFADRRAIHQISWVRKPHADPAIRGLSKTALAP